MLVGAYTFWDVIWTMIVFFAWVMVIAWVISDAEYDELKKKAIASA